MKGQKMGQQYLHKIDFETKPLHNDNGINLVRGYNDYKYSPTIGAPKHIKEILTEGEIDSNRRGLQHPTCINRIDHPDRK